MDRRTFLKWTAAAPGIAAAQPSPRRVIVIGGGLSGLSAAYELERAGLDVLILEARTRPGGRVYTMREPFSDGLYAEAGAARIQDSHPFTLRYVRQFQLTLDPFFPADGSRVTLVNGKRIVVPAGKQVDMAQLPLAFSAEERRMGLQGSFAKYLGSHVSDLGDTAKPDWPGPGLSRFEVSLPDFVRAQGASEGMMSMLTLGHDLDGMSALFFLRDAALHASTKLFYKIRGGNDQLPKALAAKMAGKILYGAPVVRLEQDERSVRAVYLRAGDPVTVTGDYMVCTMPLPVMRRVEVRPALSAQKRGAIDQIDYFPMARAYLQSRRRFWHERGENGWANTDDPLDVWDYSRDQPGQRGILGVYTSGRMAYQLTYREPAERIQFLLDMMERVHPGMRENFEGGASHSWITDPWSLGAGADFRAGQMSSYCRFLGTPEGRIHFAGDHTSPWNGWMNGALESGNRAATEIQARR